MHGSAGVDGGGWSPGQFSVWLAGVSRQHAASPARWLRPLDLEPVFTSFKKTNRCVVVEEGLPMFGVGSEIAAQLQEKMFDYMDAPVKRVSALDQPLPYSSEIELMALPDANKVVAAVKEVL